MSRNKLSLFLAIVTERNSIRIEFGEYLFVNMIIFLYSKNIIIHYSIPTYIDIDMNLIVPSADY